MSKLPTENKKSFIKLAERLGYVPTYIFSKLDKEKQDLIQKNVDVIDLSLGSPDLPSPSVVIDECISALKDRNNYRYPPFWGHKNLESLQQSG